MERLITRWFTHGPVLELAVVMLGLVAGITIGGTPTVHGQAPAPDQTPVFCGGKVATIIGTAGDDYISGTNGPNVIVGLGGNDEIHSSFLEYIWMDEPRTSGNQARVRVAGL